MIDDAVEALTAFQEVEWPPREPMVAPAAPEWMKVETSQPCEDLNSFLERHSPLKERQIMHSNESLGGRAQTKDSSLHEEVAEKEEMKEVEDLSQSCGPTSNGKIGHVPTSNGVEKRLSSARINISPSKASSSHVINPALAAEPAMVMYLVKPVLKINLRKSSTHHRLTAKAKTKGRSMKLPSHCWTILLKVFASAANLLLSLFILLWPKH